MMADVFGLSRRGHHGRAFTQEKTILFFNKIGMD